MDRGAWRAAVQGVTKSRTRLSTHTLVKGRARWEPDFWARVVNSFSGSLTSDSEGLVFPSVPEDQEQDRPGTRSLDGGARWHRLAAALNTPCLDPQGSHVTPRPRHALFPHFSGATNLSHTACPASLPAQGTLPPPEGVSDCPGSQPGARTRWQSTNSWQMAVGSLAWGPRARGDSPGHRGEKRLEHRAAQVLAEP